MKKIILAIILLINILSFAQDTTFNKLIHSYPETLNIKSLIKDDNHYYASITQASASLTYGYGILKFNSSFEIVDSSLHFTPNLIPILNNGRGFEMSDFDTSFIVVGAVHFDGSMKENGYIAKLDKNLDTVWTKQILHPDTAYADTAATPWIVLRDVKVCQNNDYLVVGNYNYHCQGASINSIIIRIDNLGNVIWQRVIPINIVSKIIEIEMDYTDSSFYCISTVYSNTEVKVLKFDKNGNFEWNTSYISQLYPTTISSLCLENQELIIASANWDNPPASSSELVLSVSKVNTQNKNIVWEKTFSNISIFSAWLYNETIDIEIAENGDILVGTVGSKYTVGANYTGFTSDIRANLLMLNSNGDSLWSHYYIYRDDSLGKEDLQFNDMLICDDGGILFGGNYYKSGASFLKAWLVKTDSLGNAPGMFTVNIEENNYLVIENKLSLYPNPTSDNINLRFDKESDQYYILSIYSSSGTLVKQQEISSFANESRINISDLANGMYIVNVVSESNIIYNSRFIKQ